jgi:acetyl-CoA acetyltransferase
MSFKDRAAVVGIGATPMYKRGQSYPAETELSLTCKAILLALEDAGLEVGELDGFALYARVCEPSEVAATLGIPEVRFCAMTTGGGGASAGSLGLAAAAIHGGMADVVVTVVTMQQRDFRLGGGAGANGQLGYGGDLGEMAGSRPFSAFTANSGLLSPGHACALVTQRHMHLYGTKREHFAEVAISTRDNAARQPGAMRTAPLTLDDYFNARMIAEPLCLYDYTLETDGAVAVITVSAERAKDLRQCPVYIMGSAHGGIGRAGGINWKWLQMADSDLASSGSRTVAKRMYEMAGVTPQDVDVAMIYDNFTPYVIMQLEDYGFAPIGEGGQFVADGNIRWKTGSLPVNTHGGNLSGGYIMGMTHIKEAVEQLRGTATNQVENTEIALVTGGTSLLPMSGTILRKG